MTAAARALLLLPFVLAMAPDGEKKAPPTADRQEAPAAPAIGPGHVAKLAEREAALAAILSFLERGEEVPNYQILLLTAPLPEESEIEAAVAASIAKADALRHAALERARERRAAASAPPPSPPPGADAEGPALPPVAAAAAAPAPETIPTERLVALGGVASADILFETGRPKEALPLYEKALSSPDSATAHAAFRRARCLELLARDAEAIAAFETAARLAGDGPLRAQAAFAARHIAWKIENGAALDALAGRKR